MESLAFSELFSLFSTANPETLEWLLSITVEQDYPPDEEILTEENWGNAVYLIVSGWVKVQSEYGDKTSTLDILGRGDFFGDMAILDESPPTSQVTSLSEVKILAISAQRFIQILFKDPQVHHRLLKLIVQRLNRWQYRWQMRKSLPIAKLAKTLVFLAENYGQPTEKGTEIINLSDDILADLIGINLEETKKIMEKLQNKGWIEIEPSQETLCLINTKQLTHFAG